jgi:hypothetical protein
MKSNLLPRVFSLACAILSFGFTFSQDTTKKRSVDITSSFKPMLKEAAKINFNATPPAADTSKPRLTYDIPNQNLAMPYQPGSLKPLALEVDSAGAWDNSSYIKAGFGSLRTPYIQAGISLGDGRTAGLNIYAKHVGSDGKREFQKYASTDVRLAGFFKTKNIKWDAGIGMNQFRTYKYGFLPAGMSYPDDSIKLNYQTIAGRIAFHNIKKTEFNLTYSPELRIDVFSDRLNNTESNTVLNLPLEKTIGKNFAVNLGLTFDLTRMTPKSKTVINNTMYYISPSVIFRSSNFNIQAGIRPSWDNKTFKMFPNVLADINTEDKRFIFQAGWTGYVRKTTYQYLVSQNPWIWAPNQQKNTWIEERFAGFKGSVGDHLTYNAKVGFNRLNNQPLFVNDTVVANGGGKTFRVLNESKMNVVNFNAQVGYAVQEKFSVTAGLVFNQYSGLRDNAEAWGMIPLELNANMRLQVIKDLWLKTDLFAWTGAQYMKKDGSPARLAGATDLNAGLEFRITKNLNAWAQFNNVFNKEYQRWNQYPVYGFNFVGGIVYSFNQKN